MRRSMWIVLLGTSIALASPAAYCQYQTTSDSNFDWWEGWQWDRQSVETEYYYDDTSLAEQDRMVTAETEPGHAWWDAWEQDSDRLEDVHAGSEFRHTDPSGREYGYERSVDEGLERDRSDTVEARRSETEDWDLAEQDARAYSRWYDEQ